MASQVAFRRCEFIAKMTSTQHNTSKYVVSPAFCPLMATKNRQTGTNSSKKRKLSPAQIKALDLMMVGASSEEIAQQVGKSTRTVERWKKLDSFRHVTSEVRQKVQNILIDDFSARLTHLGTRAITVVEEVLDNPEESSRTRLQAATLAGKWAGLESLELKFQIQALRWLEERKNRISDLAYSEIKNEISSFGASAESKPPDLAKILEDATTHMLED